MDIRVHFELASKAQIRGLLWRVDPDLKIPDIEQIAVKFVDAVEERTVSTAQLQGWFIKHKTDPVSALADISIICPPSEFGFHIPRYRYFHRNK